MYPIPNGRTTITLVLVTENRKQIKWREKLRLIEQETKTYNKLNQDKNEKSTKNDTNTRTERGREKEKILSNVEMDTHHFDSNIHSHQILC